MAQTLATQECKPCTAKTPRIKGALAKDLHREIPAWVLEEDRLVREWSLHDFAQAMAFANDIAQLAEEEQHHPDLHLTGYNHLKVVLSTHAIGGLSRNDFVLAAKIDRLRP